jgi:hypothetical protein
LWPQSQSGRYSGEKNITSPSEIEFQFLGRPTHRQSTVEVDRSASEEIAMGSDQFEEEKIV